MADALWLQTELSNDSVDEWQAVGAAPSAALALDELGWTPAMGGLIISHLGATMTIARAVSQGPGRRQSRLTRVPDLV